jgi:gliding motility-associated-like protein
MKNNKLIILVVCILIILSNLKLSAQQAFFGNTYIPNNAEVVVFGHQDFLNNNSSPLPGKIGVERTNVNGLFSFHTTNTYTGALNTAHVDGYVKYYSNNSSMLFMFPSGNNNKLGLSGVFSLPSGTSASAAYFNVDPNTATAANLISGTLSALPTGAPFSRSSKDTSIILVSTKEYWDINGSTTTRIILTWDTSRSDVNTITNSKLYNLVIAGWNGSKWENLGASNVIGSLTSSGSITTKNSIVPDSFKAYTFAAISLCFADDSTPNVVATNLQNICPANTASLNTISVTNRPINCILQWHTALPATNANLVSNPSAVGAGKYYAVFKDTVNNCFSKNGMNADSITVNIVSCCNSLSASITKTDCSNASNNDGSAQANVSGGTAPFTFLWSNNSTNASIGSLTPGTYKVTVTDAVNCTVEQSVVINTFICSTPNITFAKTDIKCFGASTGSITANITGGTAPYSFLWSNSSGGQGNTQTISSKPAGSYSLTVTDSKGCSSSSNISLIQGNQLTASIVTSSCNTKVSAPFDGNAVATASGGKAPYTFLWSNNATTSSITNVQTPGIQKVVITDSLGCKDSAQFSCSTPGCNNLAISSISKNNVSCFNGNNGSATPVLSGGTSPFKFKWSNNDSTSTTNNLTAGSYLVTVTDNANCTVSSTVSITQPSQISTSFSVTNARCVGTSTGAIDLQVSGGSSPYTYDWSSGNTTQDINNVSSGNYTVVVKDANNCSVTVSTTISQPASALSVTISKNDPSIAANNNGSASATANGGVSPYTFKWSNNLGTNSSVSNLSPGTYTVTVTDANNCTVSTQVVIATFVCSSPILSFTNSTIPCFGGSNGTSAVNVSGGSTPYTFSWSTGATTQSISNNKSGSYSVTVTDSKGCTSSSNTFISERPQLTASTISSCNTKVNSPFDGNATVTPSGGTKPYTFKWVDGTNTQIATTASISNVGSGAYAVTVTDSNNCTIVESFSCASPGCNNLTISSVSIFTPKCNGDKNGSAIAIISGGTAPYTYTWSNNGSTNDSIKNIGSGSYAVTVRDNANCTSSRLFTVNEPAKISASISNTNISCFNGSSGVANLQVSGGTSPYTYMWSNNSTTEDLNNVVAGNYSVVITDANNCKLNASTIIQQPASEIIVTISKNDLSTMSNNNGNANASVSGGTSPYTFSWSNGLGSNAAVSNLSPGTYNVTVTDANNCTAIGSVVISDFVCAAPSISFTNTKVICGGASTGASSVSASGGSSPYSYLWSTGATTSSITSQLSGSYSVTVTDSKGCKASSNTFISENSKLNPLITYTCNTKSASPFDGLASVSVTGGTAPYAYKWADGNNSQISTTSSISNIGSGNYSVTVTDANNCTVVESFNCASTACKGLSIVSVTTTKPNCFGGATGSASAMVSGGTSPYTFAWSSGASTTSSNNNIAAGSYNVTVTDALNCTATKSFVVENPTKMTASVSSVNTPCLNGNTGIIDLQVTGGRKANGYKYAWSNGDTTEDLMNLVAGAYSVTVTDANNCTVNASATIQQGTTALNLTLATIQPSSSSNNDGAIEAQVSGGSSSTYSYLWSNNATTAKISSLTPNRYCVTVSDLSGCRKTLCDSIKPFNCIPTGKPTLSNNSISNICPILTSDLTKITPNNQPVGSVLEWHTSLPASSNTKVSNPGAVNTGTYFAVYFNPTSNCYSNGGNDGTSVLVTNSNCTDCNAGNSDPKLSSIGLSNICPATTADLTLVTANNQPNGTILEWHTSLPASSNTKVSNPGAVSAGIYFAVFFDVTNNCYSKGGQNGTPLIVTITSCPNPCKSGPIAPKLSQEVLTNNCPTTSADLTSITSSNTPSGAVLQWHSGVPATSANKVQNPSQVLSGTYYAVFYDATNNCYSGDGFGMYEVKVSTTSCPTNCNAGKVAPVLSANQITNICPATTVDLTTIATSNRPVGAVLQWHTNIPTNDANKVQNPKSVISGTYYAVFYDSVNKCYTTGGLGTTSVIASTTNCPNPCNSGNYAPDFKETALGNICPIATVDLTAIKVSNQPKGTVVQWHTGLPASNSNKVSNPAQYNVTGKVYAVFYDATNNCYSQNGQSGKELLVVIKTCPDTCNSGNSNPILSGGNDITNICPALTSDLTVITASNLPSGVKLQWHTALPATSANKVSNPKVVNSGTYYAVFFDSLKNCYSLNGASGTQVIVTNTTCPKCLVSGNTSPQFSSSELNTTCPLTTANLNNVVVLNKPKGVIVRWYTSNTTNSSFLVSNPTAVSSGIYYATFYDSANNCLANNGQGAFTPVTVTETKCCNAGTEAPMLDALSITNICPDSLADLTYVSATNQPNGVVLEWHSATPVSASTKVANPYAVRAGTYYAVFYDVVQGCYSSNGNLTTPLSVTLRTCTDCSAGESAPMLPGQGISNTCPATTVDLTSIKPTNQPSGIVVEWHTSPVVTSTSRVKNPNAVTTGTYYAIYFDPTNQCYAGEGTATQEYIVTITNCNTPCNAGANAPIFSQELVTNTCPSKTVDLSVISASNRPSGTVLQWHSAVPTRASNKLSSNVVSSSGTYYAVFFDPSNNCYSGAGLGTKAVQVVIKKCDTPSYCDTFSQMPVLSRDTAINNCPTTTVDLTQMSSISGGSVIVSWHTATPASMSNRVFNPSQISAGTYYAVLYDTTRKCFSLSGMATRRVVVSTSNCPECQSGIDAPRLSVSSLTNPCPIATVDLTKVTATNTPKNTQLTWHTSLPASNANRVSNPSAVSIAGTYYAAFFDAKNNCYSDKGNAASPVTVTLINCNTPCNSGNIKPVLSASTLKNICPTTSANLLSISVSNKPTNQHVVLQWHTDLPASTLNKVANPSYVSTGTYYAVFYDSINKCYSNAGQDGTNVLVSLEDCNNKCIAGKEQPKFESNTHNNVCPDSVANLTFLVPKNKPEGTVIEWRTSTGVVVSRPDSVRAGTYFPYFRDTVNKCYSTGADNPITVTLIKCVDFGAKNDYVKIDPTKPGATIIDVASNDGVKNGSKFSITPNGNPKKGTATIDPRTGQLTYTPSDTNYVGYDTIEYQLCDTIKNVCSTAYVIISLNKPKDTTVTNPTNSNGTVDVDLKDNKGIPTKPSDATENYSIVTNPNKGSVVINPATGRVTYTKFSDSCGMDSVQVSKTFKFTDGRPDEVYTFWIYLDNKCPDDEDIPNYISPNGDGKNENFVLPASFKKKYPNLRLAVFNRWGNMVWRSNGVYQNNWGGSHFDGELLPDGVYYYIIELENQDEKTKTGFIQVMRH